MPKGIFVHPPLGVSQKVKIGLAISTHWATKRKGKTYEDIFGVVKAKAMREKQRLAKLGKSFKWSKPHPSGENHPRWIKDRNLKLEKHRLRSSKEWADWRKVVFARDGYICMECGDLKAKLEPHHIIPLRMDMAGIFNIKNGIALCRPCHNKTLFKESSFAEHFAQLVAPAQM